MKKYLVLSFDDGTVADKRVIEILNSKGLKGTFNLNTGLQDYKYYMEGKLVERLDLKANKHLYDNHEVASHTLTHANLFKISEEEMKHEVLEDIKNIEEIFGRQATSISIPYGDYDEDRLMKIKNMTHLRCFRHPMMVLKGDYKKPADPYHVGKCAIYDDPDVFEKIKLFEESQNDGIFVLLADPYKIDVYNKWEHFNKLIDYIANSKGFEVKTMTDACGLMFE